MDEPRTGDVVAGCAVVRLLGRGAMGSAHLARRTSDGRAVVVKLLDADLASDPELRARFEREWQALRKVSHPNVVQVLALDAGGPRPALVLEYVEGAGADAALKRHGRVAWPVAARVGRDVARGLAAGHAAGVVHRDVKPANIVVGQDGAAKLIDFGVAKDLARRTGLTQPGALLGTAYYMAPEVWQQQAADARVDLFALGATLHHLVAGRPPFHGADLDEVADRVLAGEHEPLRRLVPEVPADLEAVVEHLLDVDPDARYARADDVAADLERVLAGQPPHLPTLFAEGGAPRLALVGAEWFTLGADPACRLVLPHPSVAPRHAQVRRERGVLALYDLQAPAGTWLGAERVTPGAPRELRDGDVVRLGEVRLRFRRPL